MKFYVFAIDSADEAIRIKYPGNYFCKKCFLSFASRSELNGTINKNTQCVGGIV